MAKWPRLGVALTLLVIPAGVLGATFPCTHAGLESAVQTGGGPHALDCTTADTITVPGPGGLSIASDLILDLGGVTIEFESAARGRIYFLPTLDCTSVCVFGSTTASLSNFSLRGGVTISNPGFSPPGNVDVAIHKAFIRAPASTIGGIHVTGVNTFLHLSDSTLDGNRTGIRLDALQLRFDLTDGPSRLSVR